MKFGEKLKKLRTEQSKTQEEVSSAIGVTRRTYIGYEQEGRYPRKREVYAKLAAIFHCDVNYLMTEDEDFIFRASEQYGSRGRRQAEELVEELSGMFVGEELSEEDKDSVMLALQKAYWLCKEDNKKFAPRKYRKDGD